MAQNYIVNSHLTAPTESVTAFLMEDSRLKHLAKSPANAPTRKSVTFAGNRPVAAQRPTTPKLARMDLSSIVTYPPSHVTTPRTLTTSQKTPKEQPETLTQARFLRTSPKEKNLEDQTKTKTQTKTNPNQIPTQARNVYETPAEAAKRSFAAAYWGNGPSTPAGYYMSAEYGLQKYTQPLQAKSNRSTDLADGLPVIQTPVKVSIRPVGCTFACMIHHGIKSCECPLNSYMWIEPDVGRLGIRMFPATSVEEVVPTPAAEQASEEEVHVDADAGVDFDACPAADAALSLEPDLALECANSPVSDVAVEQELPPPVDVADATYSDDDDTPCDHDEYTCMLCAKDPTLRGIARAVAADEAAVKEESMTTGAQDYELPPTVDDADVTDTDEDEDDVFYDCEEIEHNACYDPDCERCEGPDEVDRRFADELYGGAEAYRTAYLEADDSEPEATRVAAAEAAEAEAIVLGKAALEAEILRAIVAKEVETIVQDLRSKAAVETESIKAAAAKAAAEIEALSHAASTDICFAKVSVKEDIYCKASNVKALGDALVDVDDKIALAVEEISASKARDFEAALSEATREAEEALKVTTREVLHQEMKAFRSDFSTHVEEELERVRFALDDAKLDEIEAIRDTAAQVAETWAIEQALEKAAAAEADAMRLVVRADELHAEAERLRCSFMLKFGFETEENVLDFLNQRTSVIYDNDLDIGYSNTIDEETEATGGASSADKVDIIVDPVPVEEAVECREEAYHTPEDDRIAPLLEYIQERIEDVADYEGEESPTMPYMRRFQEVVSKLHQIMAAPSALPQTLSADAAEKEIQIFTDEVDQVVLKLWKFFEGMSQLSTGRDLEEFLALGATGLNNCADSVGVEGFERKVAYLEGFYSTPEDEEGPDSVVNPLISYIEEMAENVATHEGERSPTLTYLCRILEVVYKLRQIKATHDTFPQVLPAGAVEGEESPVFLVKEDEVTAENYPTAMSHLENQHELWSFVLGYTGLSESSINPTGLEELEKKVASIGVAQKEYEETAGAPSEYRVTFSPGSRNVSYRASSPTEGVQSWEDSFWKYGKKHTPTVVLDIDAYDIDELTYSDENGKDFSFPESTDIYFSDDEDEWLAETSTDSVTPEDMADTADDTKSDARDTADAAAPNARGSLAEEVPPLHVQGTGSRIAEHRVDFVENIFHKYFCANSFQNSLERSFDPSPRTIPVLKPCRETNLENTSSLNLEDNTMPFKQDKSAFNKTVLRPYITNIADLLITPEFEKIAKWGARRCFAPKQLETIRMKDKAIMTSVPRNTPSLWAYLAFLTKLIPEMDTKTVALYRQFVEEWRGVEETECHTRATCYQYNLYLMLTMNDRFNLRTLRDWMTGTTTHTGCEGCHGCEPGREELSKTEEVSTRLSGRPRVFWKDVPIPAERDTADSYITRSQVCTRVCMRCGQYYHTYGHITENECPNTYCERFQGIYNQPGQPSTKVFTEQAVQDEFLRRLFTLHPMDLNFGLINLFRGKLEGVSELICRAGISKLLWRLKDSVPLYEADEERVKWCARRFYGSENYDVLFPSALTNKYFHWSRDTMDSMRDTMDSDNNKPDALAMVSPGKGEATTAQPGTAVTGGGHAAVDVTSNLQAGTGAEIVQPGAVSTGAGAGETILTTFGGLPTELLQMGGYVNSILAFIYNPVPLATIAVNSTTLEYATLYSWKVNPWDLDSVGPYIHKWAELHQRFSGGFNVGLQVSTTAVIVGKIGLYYIPAGMKIPTKKTRTNMKIFDHTVIDLYTPSSNQLEIRMTSQNDFYATKDTAATRDYGQVLIMAYTAISNTMGGDTSPPVYPTICLTEDSIYSVPLFDSQDLPPSTIMAPTLPYDTFCVTEGHNVAPHYFENDQKATRAGGDFSDSTIGVQWMTTSGRIKAEESDKKGENEMSFYWGARFTKADPGFADAMKEIGDRNENPHRYMYNFITGDDGRPKFDGLTSIADAASIGRTYNKQDTKNGLAGTDQFAQKFQTEEFIHTIGYITAGFKVWKDPVNAPYWGGFTSDGAETVYQVPIEIEQFGESPSSLKVRMVTSEALGSETRSKFFEVRASGLGLSSTANVPYPDIDSQPAIQNPAPFHIGPEIPQVMNSGEGMRACPIISLTESVVCNETPDTTGQDVPPGFKLLTFWDPEDPDNWYGLPAVLPGVRGVTTAVSKLGEQFMIQVRAYLAATKTKSYVMACVSTDSSMEFEVLCNNKGAFIYAVDWDYAVIPTKTNYFYTRFLSADSDSEWVGINPPTDRLFQSRLSATRSHSGFVLDGGNRKTERVPNRPLYKDTMDSGVAAVFGGMLGGIGQAIGSIGDRHFKEEMQRNKFAQESSLQKRSIAGQMVMNQRNVDSRDYATRKQAETQENISQRNARTQVEIANTRVIAGNGVSNFSG